MSLVSRFDRKFDKLIHKLPDFFRPIMSGATFLGEPTVVGPIALVGFVSALQKGQPNVERAFIYATIAYAISTILKLVLRRRRPHNLDVKTLGVKSYSFPSGHAFGTLIYYGLFAYWDYHYLNSPWNILITAFLSTIILLVGVSRVYLDKHYPSDVLAGWILGGISLVLVINLAF